MTTGRLKIGAALVLCSPFVPMLFHGEEFGASTPFQYFTNHDDPKIARAVSEGRRREFEAFGWKPEDVPDPQDPATFLRSKLDWSELDRNPHREILEWHRQLIQLRRSTPALKDGRMDRVQVQFDEREQWLLMRRGPIVVACNLATTPRRFPIHAETLLASDPESSIRELAPDSVVVASDLQKLPGSCPDAFTVGVA
jgi:maltooligosyltrehalose trehalohydrolase